MKTTNFIRISAISSFLHPRKSMSDSYPFAKISRKQFFGIAFNFLTRHATSIVQQIFIRIEKGITDKAARVIPFVNKLVENSRIRVLRDKTRSQKFESLTRDFGDNRGIIHKPPTAKRH
jgi:hypothetical protein